MWCPQLPLPLQAEQLLDHVLLDINRMDLKLLGVCTRIKEEREKEAHEAPTGVAAAVPDAVPPPPPPRAEHPAHDAKESAMEVGEEEQEEEEPADGPAVGIAAELKVKLPRGAGNSAGVHPLACACAFIWAPVGFPVVPVGLCVCVRTCTGPAPTGFTHCQCAHAHSGQSKRVCTCRAYA